MLPEYSWDVNTELETAAIAALEQEMQALKGDRAQVSKLRAQLEQASVRMEQEKAAWKCQQVRLCLPPVPRSVASVAVHTNQAPCSWHTSIPKTAGASCRLPLSSFAPHSAVGYMASRLLLCQQNKD